MAQIQFRTAILVLCSVAAWTSGCTTSSAPVPAANKSSASSNSTASNTNDRDASSKDPATASDGTAHSKEMASVGNSKPGEKSAKKAKTDEWGDYPDIPRPEIMTEVNGIKIPRQVSKDQTLEMGQKIPADVGNAHAAKNPSQPVTGDTLTIRFNAEPKVLNSITENSAVQKYMITKNVSEGLGRQNTETFEFEPHIASKWVIEDSIKLSPDYPGQERRIAIEGGPVESSLVIEYTAPPRSAAGKKDEEPPKIAVKTLNKDGQPAGNTWVGVYPIGKIVGVSATGYHIWSNAQGTAEITAIPTGKYEVKVGSEIYGKANRNEDGSLVVTPTSAENPLHLTLKSSSEASLTLKPGEWTELHEQTYYTFYLRDDVKWSDGTPFTTKDIEFGYNLLNSKFVDGDAIRTYYQDLIECKPFGPHVVRMRYQQPYFMAIQTTCEATYFVPPFHFFSKIFQEKGRELTFDHLMPEEEAAQKKISVHGQEFGKFFNTDDRFNRAPLGTGPYIVDKWVSKDRVELVRNPHYWNKERAGHLDRIIYKFIPDQVSAMAALKAGEIDFFYDMSAEQYFEDWPNLDEARKNDYVQAAWYSPMFAYFGWNLLAPQLQDRRVRIAMALLFDRQNFVDTKLHGAGTVVSGTQYYFGMGYDHEVVPLGYDPEVARELLADAGWIDTDNDGILDREGQKFQLTLSLPQGKPITIQQCEVFQKNLKSVGIDLKIQLLEWASFIDKVKAKECDVITLRWAVPPESDPFQIWHSSGAGRESRGSNHVSFANAQADTLIEKICVTLDPVKRQRLHWSLHRLLDSEQPYMFLWIPKEFGAYHKRFRNVKWYRLRPGFEVAEWYVPKNEQLHTAP